MALITIEPCRAELTMACAPYTMNTAQMARPRTSATRSRRRAAAGGSAVRSMSSRTCVPAVEQPRRHQERGQGQAVLGDVDDPGQGAEADIAGHDVGGDEERHDPQQHGGRAGAEVEQPRYARPATRISAGRTARAASARAPGWP